MKLACGKKKVCCLMKAVEAARDHSQSLTEMNKTVRCDVLDFTRIIHGQPKQIGARTITYDCGCQNFLISDGTRYLCTGVSRSVSKEGSWFCGRCGRVYKWRESSKRSSLVQSLSDANERS